MAESNEQYNRLVTSRETADWIRVSLATLEDWRRKGRPYLPFLRVGNRVRYRESEILKFLASAERISNSDPGPEGNGG